MEQRLDFPFEQVVKDAQRLVELGSTVFQKFSCDGCGARQTMDIPNKFFTSGQCEVCLVVTDIRAKGCNYLLIMKSS
jgi:hypothetical protein